MAKKKPFKHSLDQDPSNEIQKRLEDLHSELDVRLKSADDAFFATLQCLKKSASEIQLKSWRRPSDSSMMTQRARSRQVPVL